MLGRHEQLETLRATGGSVWLAGPPGVGKTTFVQALAEVEPGLTTVDCSEAQTATAWIDRILAVLPNLTLAEISFEALAQRLSYRHQLILVLDHLEHLPDTVIVSCLEAFAAHAPDVRLILVAQRHFEHPQLHTMTLDPLGLDGARRLFLQHARNQPETPEESKQLNEVLVALDGLPLTIIHVARRSGLMTFAQLHRRVLEGQSLSAHHDSVIQAVLEASWSGLSPQLQEALSVLSMFRASFSLESAEQLLGDPMAMEWLMSLVDSAWITRHTVQLDVPTVRFRLLQTMREFVASKQPTPNPTLLKRYIAIHADFAWSMGEAVYTKRSAYVRARFVLAYQDLYHALKLACAGEPSFTLGRLIVGIANVESFAGALDAERRVLALWNLPAPTDEIADELWVTYQLAVIHLEAEQGHYQLAQRQLEAILDVPCSDLLRVRLLLQATFVCQMCGQFEHAWTHMDQAEAICSTHPGQMLYERANLAMRRATWFSVQDQPERCQPYLEQALRDITQVGEPNLESLIWEELGHMYGDLKQHQASIHAYEEALQRAREVGAEDAFTLAGLGVTYLNAEQHQQAERVLLDSFEIAAMQGRRELMSIDLYTLVLVHLEREQLDEALEMARRCLRHARPDDRMGGSRCYWIVRALLAAIQALLGHRQEAQLAFDEVLANVGNVSLHGSEESQSIALARCLLDIPTAIGDGVIAQLQVDPMLTQTALGRTVLRYAQAQDTARPTLWLDLEARTMQINDEPVVNMRRRGSSWRIVCALARQRQRMDADALFEAGWPAERATYESRLGRVYTVIRRLRDLGLRQWLVTEDQGYRLLDDLIIMGLEEVVAHD